jgi:hypothetical protein
MNIKSTRLRMLSLIALSLIAGGLVSTWLWHSTSGRSDAGADRLDERVTSLETQVKRIDLNLERIASLAAGSPSGSRLAGPATRGPNPDAESEGPLQNEERSIQDMRAYAARFRSEATDPRWGPSTEADLTRAMLSDEVVANADVAPSAYRIQCKTTLCEMSFDFPDAGDGEGWMSTFATMTGGKLRHIWYTTLTQQDGSVRMQMYGTK